jgi:hypothetical protein
VAMLAVVRWHRRWPSGSGSSRQRLDIWLQLGGRVLKNSFKKHTAAYKRGLGKGLRAYAPTHLEYL